MKRTFITLLLWPSFVAAAEPVKLEITPVRPVRVEPRGAVEFVDFGQDAYGFLQVEFPADPPAAEWKVRLGEKLAADGAIDRKPPGSVNYREARLTLNSGKRSYRVEFPPRRRGGSAVSTPPEIGLVEPFRYAEIEGSVPGLDRASFVQMFVHAPFNDDASSFESSNPTLNAVWNLCKHTMKATTAFGVYIDGDRERTPYEADAYINQLSHYACDLDPRVARYSFGYLLKHPTWPTEWSFHMPMIAAEDYMATGDIGIARDNYDALKLKLMMEKTRAEDGLLRAPAVVDWPAGERDDYNNGVNDSKEKKEVGPELNTVANAFYYHALRQMAMLAEAARHDADARELNAKADRVRQSFNRVFLDPARGIYTDGEGCTHCSLHANMFALAFGLVPEDRQAKVADFVQSRGMACSVYGAQYLLEALFGAGRDEAAVKLMTTRTERSWWHMIDVGSTLTTEAWDVEFKKNLTWNHAWGAAPANIVSRFVLGVRPLEPGYAKLLIAPQPGWLKWVRGKVPTPHGLVTVSWNDEAGLDITVPSGTTARVVLPGVADPTRAVLANGKAIAIQTENEKAVIERLEPGTYAIRAGAKSKN
jgi:alpha-L-rhamnosidase